MRVNDFNNVGRILLFLLILLAPLKAGWIFRHHNGIFFCDIPLFFLVFYSFTITKYRFYWALPVLGFIVWSLLTGILAQRFDIVFSESTRILRGYLAFLCIINFTRNRKDFDFVFMALLCTFCFQSIIGFIQWRTGYIGLRILGEDSFAYRAGGLFTHPNIFADFLILLLPITLRLFAFYKHKKKNHNLFYAGIFLLGLAALYATLSRGAWLSFVGAMVIMFLYNLFKIKFYPKVIGGVAFLVLFGTAFAIHYTPTIISQFEGKHRQNAASVRLPLNRVALRMIKDNPIYGVGLGNYELHTHEYAREEVTPDHNYWSLLQVVHNSYLLILAETGIVGFLLYLSIMFLIFKYGWQVLKKKDPYISNIGLGLLGGYIGLFVAFIGGPDYQNHQMQMIFWIVAGFLINLGRARVTIDISELKSRLIKNKFQEKIRKLTLNS